MRILLSKRGDNVLARSKAILSLAAIFLCLMIFSQSVFAFTAPKSVRERRLGSKPSWVSGIPVISRVIWESKYPRTRNMGNTTLGYTYGEIVIVLGALAVAGTIVVLGTQRKRKRKKV